MEGLVLFVGLVLLAVIIVPIWALIKAYSVDRELRDKTDILESRVRRLESLTPELAGRPSKAKAREKEVAEEEVVLKEEIKIPPVPPPQPKPVVRMEPIEEHKPVSRPPMEKKPEPRSEPRVERYRPPEKSELEKRWENFIKNVDWEQFTGVKLFAWLGGIALFCGAAFFVKYSIDRNLIPPALRLAMGALAGLGLVIWSLRIDRKKYETTAQILAAGGIGVLYTVVYATSHMYNYIPAIAGLGLLALVSASAFVLAVYLEGVSISTLGALGAYAAPILLSTGQANLPALFVYLAVVNLGIFEVMRRLKSPGLFLLSVIGTLFLLALGTWGAQPVAEPLVQTCVALCNLLLFSIFLYRMPSEMSKNKAVKAGGTFLFLGLAAWAVVLLGQPGFYPLLMVTAGTILAVLLGYLREEWSQGFIPYSILTFMVALLWALTGFNAGEASWQYLLFFLYGLTGGLGPVVLAKKYGLRENWLKWLKVFPVVSLLLTILILVKGPDTSFWFWPMVMGLHLVGMVISFMTGSVLVLIALAVLTFWNGFIWITRAPLLCMEPDFFLYLLGGGVLLCVAAVALIKYMPGWLASPSLKAFAPESKRMDRVAADWMAAFPALGAFLLLGTAFLLQNPVKPEAGMATGLCFLVVALFLGKRVSSWQLIFTSLAAFALAQSCWMFRLLPVDPLDTQMLYWSGGLWLAALLAPFVFFRPAEKQKQVWQAWALFELVQALYFLKASDGMWTQDIMGWFPLGLFLIKVFPVKALLTGLEGKAERNSVLAFHGGVLLFYLSCMPVLLLSYGWMGLTLAFEAMALLWLNRRIPHPGLPIVSSLMAPAGMAFLLGNLPNLRAPGSEPILNWAVGSVALAVVALGIAARLAPEAKTKTVSLPFPAYFLWLAIASGFFLLNLMIADWFGGDSAMGLDFQLFTQSNLIQFISYSLLWSLFGSVLWRVGILPKSLRFVGLLLLCVGWLRVVILPYLFQPAVALMHPILNLGLVAYVSLAVILVFLILKQDEEKGWGNVKSFLIGLLAVLGLLALSQESGTVFQPGEPFHFLSNHNYSMALASAFLWTVYGLAMYLWPKMLDKPFRMAGIGLAVLGLFQMMTFPFRYAELFGALTPVLNVPNAIYALFIGALLYLNLKDQKGRWPEETRPAQWFWGPVLGIFSFFVLNVEVVQLFGGGGPFTFDPAGRFSQQLAYSLGWLLFAMVMLWVGIKWSSVSVRWAALVLFFATTLKIFFMDLWSLGQLYRVASFIGLAAVLILVSFLYQRFLSTGRKK